MSVGRSMTGLRPRLLCVAANPSIDRLVEVERLEIGRIHRPDLVRSVAGGKGLNVARAAARLGADVTAGALLAGHAGRWIAADLERHGIAGRFAWGPGETRTCVSVRARADRSLTEFYEPGDPISAGAWAAFEATVLAALEARPDVMTLSGSLPVGASEDGYARLAAAARDADVMVFLDVHGASLRLALAERPGLAKVNTVEAADLTGLPVTDEAETVAAARAIRELGATVAIVTMGAAGAIADLDDGLPLRLREPPTIGAYPVGSGDSFLAGLAVAYAGPSSWLDALRLAAAAATANALIPGAGELDATVARALAAKIGIERIPTA